MVRVVTLAVYFDALANWAFVVPFIAYKPGVCGAKPGSRNGADVMRE